jgi:hypothetical protein
MQALLFEEFLAVCRQWGEAQQRCSASLAAQAAQIEALTAQVVRLRGAVIVRDTRLAWLRDEPDEAGAWTGASLKAVELVICQTGCLSHDQYWRVQDHCRRTGKPCLLVEQPLALLQAQAWEALAPRSAWRPVWLAGDCQPLALVAETKNIDKK